MGSMITKVQKIQTILKPGPEGIKLISCSTQLSMKFLLLINLKLLIIANAFLLNIVKHLVSIRYHFDEKLFNLRRLKVKSKVQIEVLDEFHFADDMAKGAPTEENMQKGVSDSCDSYDLTISIKNWGSISASTGKPYKEPTNTVKGQRLQVVDKFTYLGSTLSRIVHFDDEVNARIAKAKANVAFGRLRGSIWDRSGIRPDTKLKVYRSVVLSTLSYACET